MVAGGVGKEVAGDVFGEELVVRHVGLVGANDVVAVGPGGEVDIGVVSPGVGVAA